MKKIIALLVTGLALVLTGCSQVNSAASIGKTDVPNTTVERTVRNILAERKKVDTNGMTLQTGKDLNTNAIRFHVISVLFDDVAKKIKMSVTPAEIATQRASIIKTIGSEKALPRALVNAGIASIDLPRYLRTVIIAQKLGDALKASGDTTTDGSGIQKLLVNMATTEKVKINPRWGVWNYTTGNVDAAPANTAVK